ncbi:MAG: YIP1 family protein, partial [Candidatus Aminicenantes bacterium]|nr:YIP1 family protein [Candidatus Aminicenantes bacterium]
PRNAFSSIIGIFKTPGPTLAEAARKRRFTAAMLILLVVVAACAWISAPLQMERSRVILEQSSLSQYLEGDGINLTVHGWQRMAIALWTALMSLLAVVIVAFLLYLFYGVAGVEGQYSHFFSLTVNAALIGTVLPRLILTLGTILGWPVYNWISPGEWARFAGMRGPAVSILGQMDLFTLWFIIAVSLGVAAWSGISRRRSLGVAVAYLVFKSVVLGLLGFFASRMMTA